MDTLVKKRKKEFVIGTLTDLHLLPIKILLYVKRNTTMKIKQEKKMIAHHF